MLSIARVRSTRGAAGYFAADNYYASGDDAAAGEWFGKGADALGLSGQVEHGAFEAVLSGILPGGARVGSDARHAAGTDLTFSLPKSWSLLALVGGDRRISDAYLASVKDTLSWAERNAAETRLERAGRERSVQTGNLVTALFLHDTSRAQDPQVHVHAVVANVTQGPDGKWRALHNPRLWQLGTLLNAIAMASFRERVQAMGYRTGDRLKHGNFEVAGISREAVMTFSTRRQEILAKVAELGARTPASFDAATLMTRQAKMPLPDRDALRATWREAASQMGADLAGIIRDAQLRSQSTPSPWDRFAATIGASAAHGRALIADMAAHLGLDRRDPYLPRRPSRLAPQEAAAAHAVAAALHHLEQREAAFTLTDIYKAALDLHLPTDIHSVERQVERLRKSGAVVQGTGRQDRMMTTRGALMTERAILTEVDSGRDQGRIFVAADVGAGMLQDNAERRSGLTLNPGQLAGGALLLSSPDRIVAIQGVAGAGKSRALGEVAELMRERNIPVIGLAVQNTLVQMLERETGIPSITVARFVNQHRSLLEPTPDRVALATARHELGGAVLLVDEASMLSNMDQLALARLANIIGVGRMAFVGDARQLGAVDAGKPFSLMQQAGAPTAHMPQNLRARGTAIREAAAAAQIGAVDRAMAALAPFTIEAPGRASAEAAERWLSLSPDERRATAIYASGRRLRGEINHAVQTGLKGRGELGRGSLALTVLDRVSLTDEQLRDTQNYAAGMVVEITRAQRGQRIPRARATVTAVDHERDRITLQLSGGAERVLRPGRIRRGQKDAALQLYEPRALVIHDHDRIRWTANDRARGLFNADQAEIMKIDETGVALRTAGGIEQKIPSTDPMLERLDLAYALNAHMAQGLTSDRGIAVMETRDTKLVTQQMFLVTVTRLRDELTLIVDRAGMLERQLARTPGSKTSALETVDGLSPKGARGSQGRLPPELQHGPGDGRTKPFEIEI